MVPKPPKNEIRILTRNATSKKTSKYQIRTLFAMFAAYPGPPKNRLFGHFLETKTNPGAPPEGTCKTACKKVTPFSQKQPKSDPRGTPDGSQNPSKIRLWSIGDPPAAANRSQRCSGGGKPPKISHNFALGGQNYGMLSFYAMGGIYIIIFDQFLNRLMATFHGKLIFAIYYIDDAMLTIYSLGESPIP